MSLRLAVATEDFGTNLKRSIAQATTLAVDGVRLNTRTELDVQRASASALRQILLYVTERKMNVAGLFCPTKHALYEPEFLEPRLEVIRQSMGLAGKLNTRELIVRCGPIPDPRDNGEKAKDDLKVDAEDPFAFAAAATTSKPSPAKEFSTLCEILNDLAAFGNHIGCVLQLQLTEFYESHIGELFSRVTAGPMSVVFDPATAVMTGADEINCYGSHYDRTGYVRARDALTTTEGSGTEVAINRGIVKWMELIATIVEADYRGWVCVERTGGDSRADDVRSGVSYLKTLIPQSGD